jgi:hypothetical protein
MSAKAMAAIEAVATTPEAAVLTSGALTSRCHRHKTSEDQSRYASRILHEKLLPLADSVLLGFCDFHCGQFSSRMIRTATGRSDRTQFSDTKTGSNEKEKQTPMRKTKKRLDKGKEARRLARSAAAAPAATKVVPDKREKPEKHKKKWVEEGQ